MDSIICPLCGHCNIGTNPHYKTVTGRWNKPSWFERIFQGKKNIFIPKTD